jgi:hypothetical protein
VLRLGTLLVATLLGIVALPSCGGDEAAPLPDTVADYVAPEGITVEEWRESMGAVCEAFDPGDLVSRPEPESPEEAMALIRDVFAVFGSFVDDMAAVPPPAGRVRDQEQLQNDLGELRGVLMRGAAAIDRGDPHAAYAMIRELSRQSSVITTRLVDLGVTACTE